MSPRIELYPSVMLDLETFGTDAGSAIVQIGAVLFGCKPQGHKPAFFSQRVSLQSSLLLGLEMNSKTLDWWRDQSKEAKAAVGGEGECVSIRIACQQFTEWFSYWEDHLAMGRPDKKLLVWSHGAAFDVPQLEATLKALGYIVAPWNYRNVRDTRTLFAMATDLGWDPKTNKDFGRNGVEHDAYWDCLRQAADVMHAINYINNAIHLTEIMSPSFGKAMIYREAEGKAVPLDGSREVPKSVLINVDTA
jgi:hypothetical protein